MKREILSQILREYIHFIYWILFNDILLFKHFFSWHLSVMSYLSKQAFSQITHLKKENK